MLDGNRPFPESLAEMVGRNATVNFQREVVKARKASERHRLAPSLCGTRMRTITVTIRNEA